MRTLTLALFAIGVSALGSAPEVILLADDTAPFVAHFNARTDRLRFVAILSPT